MTSTTPTQSRPHTPLRPPSRSSFRNSTTVHRSNSASGPPSRTTAASMADTSISSPLDSLEPQFAELADSLSVLEQNMLSLQLLNESLSRFNENFAAFLYGLEMNAFVVDWPEAPVAESWVRNVKRRGRAESSVNVGGGGETGAKGKSGGASEFDTSLLSDTTFASMRQTPKRRTLGQDIGAAGGAAGTAEGRDGRGGLGRRSGIPARSGGYVSGAVRGGAGGRGRSAGRGRGIPGRGRGAARTSG